MRKYLIKFKIIDFLNFSIENANQQDFVEKLKKEVDADKGIFGTMTEAFSSSQKPFKGAVSYDKFELRGKQKFFDNTSILSLAKGKIRQERDNLIFEVEIDGFATQMKFFIGFALVFYVIFIAFFITLFLSAEKNSDMNIVFFPFIIFHGLFMIGIPVFMMKRSVKKLKHLIEREFFYIAKK